MSKTAVDPYASAAAAFSASAALYDSEVDQTRLGAWLRARSLAWLERIFPPQARLLEIGCGTGSEAVALARRGARLVATDVAPAMLVEVEAKAAAAGVAGRIATRALPAGRLGELRAELGAASLDGAYSSLGPLNCEPELPAVATALAELVRPGGRLVLSAINRVCLWETGYFLAKGRPRAAARRWPPGWQQAKVAAELPDQVPIRYLTAQDLARAFAPAFRLERRAGLPFLLPPLYLAPLVERYPRLFAGLARLEPAASPTWLGTALGDHVLVVLRRA